MTKIKNKETGEWEDVANLTQSDVIRNPDWSRVIEPTMAQIKAGWTAPEDGIFIGYWNGQLDGKAVTIVVNGNAATRFGAGDTVSGATFYGFGNAQIPVCAGDVLTFANIGGAEQGAVTPTEPMHWTFVPYKVIVPNLAPETLTVVQNGSITFDRTGKSLMTIISVQGESGSPAYLAGLTDAIPLDFVANIVGKTFMHCFSNDPADRADIFTVTAVSGNMVTIKYLYDNYAYVTIA